MSSVGGVAGDDADPTREDGLRGWLAGQHVGYCSITAPAARLVDVDAADSLVSLDKHPLVRHALDHSGLGSAVNPARLDTAVVRLPGRVGRPITQTVSRAVFERIDGAHGMAYASRLDGIEQCWALYDRTPVNFTVEPLSPDDPAHGDAVRSVASLFEIELPTAWG